MAAAVTLPHTRLFLSCWHRESSHENSQLPISVPHTIVFEHGIPKAILLPAHDVAWFNASHGAGTTADATTAKAGVICGEGTDEARRLLHQGPHVWTARRQTREVSLARVHNALAYPPGAPLPSEDPDAPVAYFVQQVEVDRYGAGHRRGDIPTIAADVRYLCRAQLAAFLGHRELPARDGGAANSNAAHDDAATQRTSAFLALRHPSAAAAAVPASDESPSPTANQAQQATPPFRADASQLTGILQRFEYPPSGHSEVVVARWTPAVCVCERVQSILSLFDRNRTASERGATVDAPATLVRQHTVAANVKRRILDQADHVVQRVDASRIAGTSVAGGHDGYVSQATFLFRVCRDGHPYFMFCASLRLGRQYPTFAAPLLRHLADAAPSVGAHGEQTTEAPVPPPVRHTPVGLDAAARRILEAGQSPASAVALPASPSRRRSVSSNSRRASMSPTEASGSSPSSPGGRSSGRNGSVMPPVEIAISAEAAMRAVGDDESDQLPPVLPTTVLDIDPIRALLHEREEAEAAEAAALLSAMMSPGGMNGVFGSGADAGLLHPHNHNSHATSARGSSTPAAVASSTAAINALLQMQRRRSTVGNGSGGGGSLTRVRSMRGGLHALPASTLVAAVARSQRNSITPCITGRSNGSADGAGAGAGAAASSPPRHAQLAVEGFTVGSAGGAASPAGQPKRRPSAAAASSVSGRAAGGSGGTGGARLGDGTPAGAATAETPSGNHLRSILHRPGGSPPSKERDGAAHAKEGAAVSFPTLPTLVETVAGAIAEECNGPTWHLEVDPRLATVADRRRPDPSQDLSPSRFQLLGLKWLQVGPDVLERERLIRDDGRVRTAFEQDAAMRRALLREVSAHHGAGRGTPVGDVPVFHGHDVPVTLGQQNARKSTRLDTALVRSLQKPVDADAARPRTAPVPAVSSGTAGTGFRKRLPMPSMDASRPSTLRYLQDDQSCLIHALNTADDRLDGHGRRFKNPGPAAGDFFPASLAPPVVPKASADLEGPVHSTARFLGWRGPPRAISAAAHSKQPPAGALPRAASVAHNRQFAGRSAMRGLGDTNGSIRGVHAAESDYGGSRPPSRTSSGVRGGGSNAGSSGSAVGFGRTLTSTAAAGWFADWKLALRARLARHRRADWSDGQRIAASAPRVLLEVLWGGAPEATTTAFWRRRWERALHASSCRECSVAEAIESDRRFGQHVRMDDASLHLSPEATDDGSTEDATVCFTFTTSAMAEAFIAALEQSSTIPSAAASMRQAPRPVTAA